jgi:lipoate-protein ligase B
MNKWLDDSMNQSKITVVKIRTPIRYNDALELQHVHGAEFENSSVKTAKLFLLQHTPVYTLGRKTEDSHLPCSEHDLGVRTGAEVLRVDRGGSVTYHGPGQMMAYLLLNLQAWGIGIHQHLDMLEAAAINLLGRFGIKGHRETGMTGVWVNPSPAATSEKICAIGVSARRWVTYHGLCLNVDLDLSPFSEIIPCGLEGKGVTSMSKTLNREVDVSDVEAAASAAFAEVYGAKTETGMV